MFGTCICVLQIICYNDFINLNVDKLLITRVYRFAAIQKELFQSSIHILYHLKGMRIVLQVELHLYSHDLYKLNSQSCLYI